MITKNAILDNLPEFSAQQLLQHVQNGIVTIEELKEEGLSASIRKELESLIANAEPNDWAAACDANTIDAYNHYLETYQDGQHRQEARNAIERLKLDDQKKTEEAIWNKVDQNDISALEAYISSYPNSAFIGEAKKRLSSLKNEPYGSSGIEDLKEEMRNLSQNKQMELILQSLNNNDISAIDILDEIDADHNFLSSSQVKQLIDNGYFNYSDLEECGIKPEFIKKLKKGIQKVQFDHPGQLTSLARQKTTEIYFWGVPSSGKSCALGAILGVAKSGRVAQTMVMDTNSQGFDYMNRLPMCFIPEKICVLPAGTPTLSTYEMGFELYDKNNRVHPITCIDFAGELVECIYSVNARSPLTPVQQSAYDTLVNILQANKTANRKIHFFVVEYGAEEKLFKGLYQDTYLGTVLKVIDDMGIFKMSTDAIYLVVTKADKIKGPNKQEQLDNYVSKCYGSFYGGLQRISQKYQINGGKVSIVPFSLGKVCFKDLCLFRPDYADRVVELLLKRTDSNLTGKLGNLIQKITN